MAESAEEKALQLAIEDLYQVFAAYPIPENMEGCPHCVDKEASLLLISKPLRDLDAEDLDHYAFKAMTTWGTEEDFKFFLPRLFELLTLNARWPIEPEVIIGKLSYGKWRTWPANEQLALENFLTVLWEVILTTYPYHLTATEGLGGIAQVIDNLHPFLISWQTRLQADELPALRQLLNFISSNIDYLVKGRFSPFSHDQLDQLVSWLLEKELADLLEREFFNYSANSLQDELTITLSRAYEYLSWIRIAKG